MLPSSDIAAIAEVAQAVNAATAAAGDAAEKAETARALWIALEAGESEYSALQALNIEHAVFMAAVSRNAFLGSGQYPLTETGGLYLEFLAYRSFLTPQPVQVLSPPRSQMRSRSGALC